MGSGAGARPRRREREQPLPASLASFGRRCWPRPGGRHDSGIRVLGLGGRVQQPALSYGDAESYRSSFAERLGRSEPSGQSRGQRIIHAAIPLGVGHGPVDAVVVPDAGEPSERLAAMMASA